MGEVENTAYNDQLTQESRVVVRVCYFAKRAQAPYAVSWRLEVTKNCFNPSTPECNACMCKS